MNKSDYIKNIRELYFGADGYLIPLPILPKNLRLKVFSITEEDSPHLVSYYVFNGGDVVELRGEYAPDYRVSHTLSESLGDPDPVAQTLTKLTDQRDEYRQHMERYQDEVKDLKSIVNSFQSKLSIALNQDAMLTDQKNALMDSERELKRRVEYLEAALKGQQEMTNQAQDIARKASEVKMVSKWDFDE